MKLSIWLLFCVMCLHGFAYSAEKTKLSVRILNKKYGQAVDAEIELGKSASHEDITVTAKSCKYSEGNYLAGVKISDAGQTLYEGYLSSRYPSTSPISESKYDIFLLKCTIPQDSKPQVQAGKS